MKYFRRFNKWMAAVAIVCAAFLMGCGKSASEEGSSTDKAKDDKEVTTKATEVQDGNESIDEDVNIPKGLGEMISNWKKTPITVSPKGAKVSIEDFAQAFCGQYDNYNTPLKFDTVDSFMTATR